MKVIALDYDDTYTADPVLFGSFIKAAQAAGHLVVMVTARNKDSHPISDGPEGVEIFYTAGKMKAKYMQEAGIMPSIWIDDMPELIGSTRLIGV